MRNTILTITAFCALNFNTFSQKEIAGVKVPETLKAGEKNLVLNGAGIREKFFLDLYVGALYLETKKSTASEIINADSHMAITLHIISSLIDSEKMSSSTLEGFEKSTQGKTKPLEKEINQFIAIFNREPIKVNDYYQLVYIPEKGVLVYKGNKLLDTIKGLEFKKALFGIWLCNNPADNDLKTSMLGK